MELNNWIPLLSLVLAIATFLVGRLTASHQAGRETGEIKTDIKYIKESVSKLEQKVDKHNEVIERTFRLEEQMKVANHRIKDLEDKVEVIV